MARAITTNRKIESLCLTFFFFLTPCGSLNRQQAHAIMCSCHETKCHFIAFSLLIFSLFFFSFNDLLIDDTPNNMLNASNNSTRPNESSAEDELDDEDDIEDKKQNGANGNDKTLLVSLLKQINMLHETNSKIFRNLHETKGKWVMCTSVLKKSKLLDIRTALKLNLIVFLSIFYN